MIVETTSFSEQSGWSTKSFPSLDSERTLVVVFGSSALAGDPEQVRAISSAYPKSNVVGCSTSGEILGTKLADGGLVAAVCRFDGTEIATASAPVERASDSFAAGEDIARRLLKPSLRAVLLFSDGIHVNGSELVRGMNQALPEDVVVTGGLAGDDVRFKSTWVVNGGEPRSGFICAAGIYGDRVRVGHGSKGGWDIFGPERRVTRSAGNVLYELDGQPALTLYKTYLGERASGLPSTALLFPLALRSGSKDERQLVRTILSVDEATKSMTFAGDVPQGSLVQLMRANFDRLIDGAGAAALATRDRCQDGVATLGIAISCVGRRLVLGERTEEEIEAVSDVLPRDASLIGFYSYGEISPYASGRCDLHNQTMTLTTIQEA
ncbi:MAG: FIST C-terminal domain-containing protein [Planctomycetes bacterium]|nr:FIST C-terminal domain-containing protein [Planctomycetota bacterium]MBI3845155.1 FIST C-terminal domain-containing protein [Planctomycetota bacterium]